MEINGASKQIREQFSSVFAAPTNHKHTHTPSGGLSISLTIYHRVLAPQKVSLTSESYEKLDCEETRKRKIKKERKARILRKVNHLRSLYLLHFVPRVKSEGRRTYKKERKERIQMVESM